MAKVVFAWASTAAYAVPAGCALVVSGAALVARFSGAEPLFGTMPTATALAILIAAAGALAAGSNLRAPRLLAGTLCVTIAVAVMAGHFLDLGQGADSTALQRIFEERNPALGRMSPPSALSILIAGTVLLLVGRRNGRVGALLVQLLAGALLLIGLISVMTQDVLPGALVPWYRYRRMAPSAAVCMIALAVSFLAFIVRSAWYEWVYSRRADEKILIVALGIIALVIIALGSATFASLQHHIESSVQAALSQAVADRASILDNIISNRLTRASIVAARPSLQELLGRWDTEDPVLAERIRQEGNSYLGFGFRGLAFTEEHGRPVTQTGVLVDKPALVVPLAGERIDAKLLWSDGFTLRVFSPVYMRGEFVGTATSEQDLDIVTRLQLSVGQLGRSAEWVLCAPSAQHMMACFPHRLEPEPTVLARVRNGVPLPMDYALSGASGVVQADDYRGEPVVAAYAPVGRTGLGVVLKIDVDELYAPLREDAETWWKWLIATAVLGSLLVASQVRPIAQRLVQSEDLSRRRADSLARSERSLRDLYAALGDGIVVLRPDGTIEFLNPAAERIFGYGPRTLVGQPISVLIPEALRAANAAATQRFLESGRSSVVGKRDLVFPAVRRDGSVFDAEFSLAEMRQDTEQRIVGVVRDVSARTALERMKGEFVAAVSHELRTPLTSIIGALEIVRESESLDEADRSFIDMAARNSERLAMLVNDIIDSERIESGGLEFAVARVKIAPFLAEAVQINQTYASMHGVFFYLEEPLPDVTVMADRDRLMQVMANLLSNAAKFSPEGEEVRVRASAGEGRVRIEVSDRGEGIPEAFKPRIFEKFAQADASDSRKKGGTGLGLAICKAIIERMHGTIGFESQVGEGTTFHIEMPVEQAPSI